MKTSCIGIGRLLGHSFRPRYHLVPPPISNVRNAFNMVELTKVIESMSERTYVGEVCTRCGLMVTP